jgi:hypothetical protein
MTFESGQTGIPNALDILGTAFENYTTAFHVESDVTGSVLRGPTVSHSRFENGTTVFSFTGGVDSVTTPPMFHSNVLQSNAGTYLNNPEGISSINSWDPAITPEGRLYLRYAGSTTLISSDDSPLILVGGTSDGLELHNVSGDVLAKAEVRSGGGAKMHAPDGSGLFHYNVKRVGNGDDDTSPYIIWGTGSPESAVTAPVGSMFIRTDGGADSVLYMKESGTGDTGWSALAGV